MKKIILSMLLVGSLFSLTGCQDSTSTINNEGIIAQEGSTVNVTVQREEKINTETNTQIPQKEEQNEYIQKAIDEEKAILASHNNMATLRCDQPHAKAGKQYEILDVVFAKNNIRYVFIDDYGQRAEINKINFEELEMIESYSNSDNYTYEIIEEKDTNNDNDNDIAVAEETEESTAINSDNELSNAYGTKGYNSNYDSYYHDYSDCKFIRDKKVYQLTGDEVLNRTECKCVYSGRFWE